MTSGSISNSRDIAPFIQRHQLVVFILLAYSISWWPWIWYQYDPITADAPILPMGPFLAALILTALCGGWAAVIAWLKNILNWRVGWQWLLFSLALPVAFTFGAVGLNFLLGAHSVASFQIPDVGSIAFRFLFIFLWIGLGEEPAWRGYALPKFLQSHNALVAAILLGIVHVIWHAPLYGVEYDSANVLPWGITVICVSIVICWMYLNTNGNLLLPMLLHTSNNTIALVWKMFSGNDQLQLWWLWCAVWVFATVVLIAWKGFDLKHGELDKF